MTADLRARIAEALRRHDANMDGAEPKHEADGAYGCCADAVMAVVHAETGAASFRFLHYTSHGRCRTCGATDPDFPWSERQRRPHRMYCGLYVGPLEHRKRGSHDTLGGYVNDCTCGNSWRDEDGGCPEAGIDWRGPRSDGERVTSSVVGEGPVSGPAT